ncbi:hypothetical protein CFC21_003070 [Triticum aestivum]|uniref:Uncharacterized protein n=2 Tax=Triticum TaxID=4564 RepID=A0A9R0QE98_TRITD|nr:hypothetical protein CFC21_003070 [Triticum aestivum]VAH08477.1 unnamed protein product [Triticum turgidum subsp. durum]
MGQKINPLGFRLGTTQKHHSFCFAQPKNYSVEIQKGNDTIHVIIHIGLPNLLKKKGAIEELEKDLQKEINSVNQRFNISIEKVKEPYRQPNILVEYIAFQSKNRVSFQKATKKSIELTKKADIRGGRLPLQTIRTKIVYCCYPIRTIMEY